MQGVQEPYCYSNGMTWGFKPGCVPYLAKTWHCSSPKKKLKIGTQYFEVTGVKVLPDPNQTYMPSNSAFARWCWNSVHIIFTQWRFCPWSDYAICAICNAAIFLFVLFLYSELSHYLFCIWGSLNADTSCLSLLWGQEGGQEGGQKGGQKGGREGGKEGICTIVSWKNSKT